MQTFNFHRYDNMKHSVPNKKDPRQHRFGTKKLLSAAAAGDLAELKRFKEEGMDCTMSDFDGRTALHFAAYGGHVECVKYVLDHCGVQRDCRDRWGNTPLDEAETFGRHDVAAFLRQEVPRC